MNGLAFPMLEHLADPRITPLRQPRPPGRERQHRPVDQGRLPALRFASGRTIHNERHLFYPPTSGELPPSSRCGELPRQDVHLVRLGRHPAEGGRPRRAARARPEPATSQNDDGTRSRASYDDKNLLGNALDAHGGPVRAGESRRRPARLQPRRRPRLRLPLLEPAGRPASDFPDPVASAAHPPGPPVPVNFIR